MNLNPNYVLLQIKMLQNIIYCALLKCLKVSKIKVEVLVLNPGEKTKSYWFNLKKVVEWLISNQVEQKNDFIVSLGGGVIGDLTGFACSITRRQ